MTAVASRVSPGLFSSVPRIGAVHRLALALVWVTAVSGAVVFTEPAPVDLFTIGLIVVLPVIGLVRFTPPLLVFLAVWLVVLATTLLATVNAVDVPKALIHNGISVYLYLSTFVFAGFIVRQPSRHTNLILHGYLVASLLAAVVGIAGYFDLPAGAFELFTRYGRATGTFKDPNVFGPFLVPALMFMAHRVLTRPLHRALGSVLGAGLVGFALLLSFSRGAWMALGIALAIYAYLAFVTAATNRLRLKIVTFVIGGGLVATLLLGVTLQFDKVGRLFEERAAVTQSYDEGPEGRFGGQQKARNLILEKPFGIGAQQFAPNHHFEEPHNVYLAMMLNCGWLGGLLFLFMVALTCLYGLRHAFRRTLSQPLFLVVYACFVGHAVEGYLIDLDHWRHFWLLMAMVWGMMIGDRRLVAAVPLADPRSIFDEPEMIVPQRTARVLRPARRVISAKPVARRATHRPEHPQGRTQDRTKGYGRRA